MIPVILDKSFLQAASRNKFRELSEQYQFIMPDVLFYELISSDEPGRSRCFKKLNYMANPIKPINSISDFLKKEQTTLKSAGRPSENYLNDIFRFNPKLSNGSYKFSNTDNLAIDEIEDDIDKRMASFIDLCNFAPELFPGICKGKTEIREENISEYEQYIIREVDELSNSLSSFELPEQRNMPTKENLNEEWTLFRWFQVGLLFSLDIVWRRGHIDLSACTDGEKERLQHDVLDMHYLILGVLQHGFATEEKKLINFYKLLCPNGILLTERSY